MLLPSFTASPYSSTTLETFIDAAGDSIIAFEGSTCLRCLCNVVVPIFLSKETRGIIDIKHVCDPERIAEIQKHHENETQVVTDDRHRKITGRSQESSKALDE